MDLRTYLISSLIVFSILLIGGTIFLIIKTESKKTINKNKSKIKKFKLANKLYQSVTQIPIIGSSISEIRRRLYINSYDEEHVLRYKAIVYYFFGWIAAITFFILLCKIYGDNYYSIGVVALMSLYIQGVTIDHLIGDDTKLLKQLVEFLKDVKHKFHEHNMVDEAIYESLELAPSLMGLHGKKIYEAIQNEEDLEKYYGICPNKYLKIIAGYSFVTKEYGDKKIDNVSLFVKNISYIIDEIKSEIFKRDQLRYWLKALTAIAVIPVIFPNIIERWMKTNFPQANFFYDSSIGVIARISILIIAFSSFTLLKQLESTNDQQKKVIVKEHYWEKEVLKVKWINKVVNAAKPNKRSKEYYKIINLLQDAGSYMQIEWLYLRRILAAFVGIALTLGLSITLHRVNIQSIKDNTSYKFVSESTTMIINGTEEDIPKMDKEVINNLVQNKQIDKLDNNKLINELKKHGITDEETIKKSAIRIFKKVDAMNGEHLKWYEVVLSLFISCLCMDIPIWMLYFQKALRRSDMDNEVFQFDTIILLLMHHERTSIQMILEWMERFSDVYSNPIRKCLNNLQNGTIEALIELKDEVKYKPFTRIVDNLIMAEQIKISEAFESLESEREFYKDERKETNKRIVKEKVTLGETLGFLPLYSMIVIYLVIPLMWASRNELDKIIRSFKVQ